MRKSSLFFALAALFMLAPALFAQDHVEVGVFADWTRLSFANVDKNFVGVGGRVGFNVNPHVAIEAEGTWDPNRAITFVSNTGGVLNTYSTDVHLVNFMAGPKFQNSGPVRVFATVKGGLLNFGYGNSSFTTQVNGIPDGNTHAVVYPGGGLEAFLGPIGLRLDVGDEIYFSNGAHNNLKVSAGPTFRF